MKLEIKEDIATINGRQKAEKALKATHVEVGLPAKASGRNKWLLALHERGAPGARIPPRPIVGPALKAAETQDAIAEGLLAACEAAVLGSEEGVTSGFEQAGKAGVSGIKGYIDAGISPGNAPITISGGWMRNHISGKPVYVKGKGFDKPMFSTGELYGAFDYEVKK